MGQGIPLIALARATASRNSLWVFKTLDGAALYACPIQHDAIDLCHRAHYLPGSCLNPAVIANLY